MSNTEAYRKALIKTRCELDLSFFIRYIFKHYYHTTWIHNWHHDEIIRVIYALERREIPNAVINMPPRYGKTEIAVILWVCWTMIRNPRAQFIHVSFSLDLALKNSAQIRDILKSPAIQRFWPIKMRDSADSKGIWLTEQGGGMKADSAAGAITGFGAGITSWAEGDPFDGAIICDDPLKPDDALSEATRKTVNDRLSQTLHSRRNHSQVPMLLVMQRLHADDPSHTALSGGVMGDKFYHANLPALSSDGVPLWPWKHTAEQLKKMEESNRHVFAGQYQQQPFIEGGEVFDLTKFRRYDKITERVTQVIHSWDTAYKAGTHNDPSCLQVWHVTDSGYYLVDLVTGRWEYPEIRRMAFDMANQQKPHAILIEDKASGQSLIQELQRLSSHPVIPIKPESDKETRGRTSAYLVEAGRVYLPNRAHWLADFEREVVSFPKAAHDDQVDAMSQALNWLRRDDTGDFMAMMDRLYGKR